MPLAELPSADHSPYRWVVCGLLFFGLLINYIDRQILSLLKPMLDERLRWTNTQFGLVNSAFALAYALSLMGFGTLVDRLGPKVGYALSITAWSLAAAGHALVGSVGGFLGARVALGLGEGGSFPSSIKAVTQWFPGRERALATSLFNSGANVGALVAPAIVPAVALRWGWHAPFLLAAAVGLVWLCFWLTLYATPSHARASRGARNAADSTTLARALRRPEAWSFVVGKAVTDPVWLFLLIWLPDFFKKTRHLDIKNSGPLLVTIYAVVTVLSILGGWLPTLLVKLGFRNGSARKLSMLAAACGAVGILFASRSGNWTAVVLLGLTGAAHQAWSANLYSTVADMFPEGVVAGVVGFGSMVSTAAGIAIPVLSGALLDRYAAAGNTTGGYAILFDYCGLAYLVAFVLQHLLAPRFEPIPPAELQR